MATPSPTPSPGHSLNPPYQTSGDRFDDKYHMSSPVLAASATRVVMATDEGHVGFGSDPREDDEENESAPLAFVWKTEPFLRPHHEQQRVCAHKITMCGEHLYAYSLERRTHVCIHHVDATKPYPLAVGSVVECLAGTADMLVVGTTRGFVVCYQLAAISAGLGELDWLEIPAYRLEVSEEEIAGLCFTPDASGFFTVDAARQLRLWGYRPTASAEHASEPSGGTAGPTHERKPESLLTAVGGPDWPSVLVAITAVEPDYDYLVESPDDNLLAGLARPAPRASQPAPRTPRPSLTTASTSALPIPGGVACNQDFIVTSLSFSYIFLVYRWRDGRADLQHVLLEPLSLRERTEEGEDLDGPEEPWSRPDFAMNRLFLITTSRIGAAICVWSLTEGALLYRLEHSFDSAVSGAFVMDELPDGCLPTGLALSKDGNLALLAVAGGYLFSWDFSALNPRPRHSGMVPYSDEDQPRLCSDLVRATCKPATQATWGPYMTRGDPAAEGHRAGRLGPPLG